MFETAWASARSSLFVPMALLLLMLADISECSKSSQQSPTLAEWLAARGFTGQQAAALAAEGFESVADLQLLTAADLPGLGFGAEPAARLLAALGRAVLQEAAELEDAGGWATTPLSSYDSDACNIDVVEGGLSLEDFEAVYRRRQPVVLRNLTRILGWPAHTAWARPQLLATFGDRVLTADASHRPYGGKKPKGKTATLAEHVACFSKRHAALRAKLRDTEPELKRRYAFDRTFIKEQGER